MSTTPSQPTTKDSQVIEHEGRELISSVAFQDAITFLSTRWKAFETASKNTNIPESERPQILREKSTGQQQQKQQQAGNTSNTGNTTATAGNKQQSSGTSTPTSKGSPWSGGRRH